MPNKNAKKKGVTSKNTNNDNKSNYIKSSHDTHSQEIEDYFKNFSHSLSNTSRNLIYFDPFSQNEFLKNANMNPRKFSREEIEQLITNPKVNEEKLRELAQYIENTVLQYKKLIFFYGSILAFDYYLEPTNADEEDMRTTSFINSHKKALNWLEKFNIKKQLPDVARLLASKDAVFYYVRENKDYITLQEMPSSYCKIVARTDYGYQYSFNISYFLQTGINIEEYAPEFIKYFEDYKNQDLHKERAPYWVDLDPLKAPVFKFDENVAGIVPPLMGLFPDSIDIATYKDLLKAKTELDVMKILLAKIPLHNDSKGTQAKNNFAIDAKTAGKFGSRMQAGVPKRVKVVVTPFETDTVDFEESQNKESLASIGNDMFYDSAAVNPIIFGKEGTTATAIKTSLKTNELFVKHFYPMFERFINGWLRKVTGRYRFKIHLEGTEFDRDERFERALKAAQFGFPKSYVATAMGKTPEEIMNMSMLENSHNLLDFLKPLISSHTLSNKEGAPVKKDVSETGEQSRDDGTNER